MVLTQPMRLKMTNWGIMVTMPGSMTVASRMANQTLRPGKVDTGEAVSAEGGGDEDRDFVQQQNYQGIADVEGEGPGRPGVDIVAELGGIRDPFGRVAKDGELRFEGAGQQPEKGEEHHTGAGEQDGPDENFPETFVVQELGWGGTC